MEKQVFVALKGFTSMSKATPEPGKLSKVISCIALMKIVPKPDKKMPTGKYTVGEFNIAVMDGEEIHPGIYLQKEHRMYAV